MVDVDNPSRKCRLLGSNRVMMTHTEGFREVFCTPDCDMYDAVALGNLMGHEHCHCQNALPVQGK